MKYKYYQDRPGTLTAEFVRDEYKKLTSRIASAEASASADEWLALYADWNALSAFVNSETSRIQHAFAKNMADKESEKHEEYQRQSVLPIPEEANSELLLAWLGSAHKEAI